MLPWATAWTLYQGSATLKLLAWSGIVLNGFSDFLMPGFVTLLSLVCAGGVLRFLGARRGAEFSGTR